MISLFDYIFYRIYKFSKEKGDFAPETNGSLLLSLIQSLTILDIMVLVRMIYDYPFPSKWALAPVAILIAVLNWYRYEKIMEIEELEKRWGGEDRTKRIRNGWFIGLYLAMSFLIPAVHGYLEHNLKVI